MTIRAKDFRELAAKMGIKGGQFVRRPHVDREPPKPVMGKTASVKLASELHDAFDAPNSAPTDPRTR